MAEREHELPHGEFLERPSYSYLQTVGVGSAGKSVLWTNEVLGRQVVSKTVDLFGVPGGLARSEPRLLEDMKHPRLVRVREAQWAEGHDPALKVVTFTTDFCEGRSVAAALAEGHEFSTRECLAIIADVLDALSYLHQDQSLIHRDVKPGNIMLDASRRRGFLGDLGSPALLKNGTVPAGGCTPLYQAPESIDGHIAEPADLYGTGMVLLELLSGAPDIESLDRDKIDKRLAEGRRSMPDGYFTVPPWVPPNVAGLVRSLTARDPARRPDSAADALGRVHNTACVDWRRTDGAGLTGRWEGQWPPSVPVSRRRLYEIRADPVANGRYKGLVHLQAARRTASKRWRNYASLARRTDPGDGVALAAFLRVTRQAAWERFSGK